MDEVIDGFGIALLARAIMFGYSTLMKNIISGGSRTYVDVRGPH